MAEGVNVWVGVIVIGMGNIKATSQVCWTTESD